MSSLTNVMCYLSGTVSNSAMHGQPGVHVRVGQEQLFSGFHGSLQEKGMQPCSQAHLLNLSYSDTSDVCSVFNMGASTCTHCTSNIHHPLPWKYTHTKGLAQARANNPSTIISVLHYRHCAFPRSVLHCKHKSVSA